MKKRIPYKLNVPGDFYVEDSCCVACDMPQAEAPEHFKYDYTDGIHCYICKQPTTDIELERMINALSVQDLDCIRYKGKDKNIIALIRKSGNEDALD